MHSNRTTFLDARAFNQSMTRANANDANDARATSRLTSSASMVSSTTAPSSTTRVRAEVKRWNSLSSPTEVVVGGSARDDDDDDEEEEGDDERTDGRVDDAGVDVAGIAQGVGALDVDDDAFDDSPTSSIHPTPTSRASLRRAFVAFAEFGTPKSHSTTCMDGTRFAKMCREVFAERLDAAAVDVAFAKRSGKTRKKIDFVTFEQLLNDLVTTIMGEGLSIEDVRARVARASPSVGAAVSPRAIRHHDDVSTYTSAARASHGVLASPSRSLQRQLSREQDGFDDVDSLPRVRGLKTSFVSFAAYSGGSHSSNALGVNRFIKLCEDCGLYRGNFDAQAAGIVFNTITGAKSKFMDFKQFQGALKLAAARAGVRYADFAGAVVARGEPLTNAHISPEPVRFHDDTSTYTSTRREVYLDRKLSTRALSISRSPQKSKSARDVAYESASASPPAA